MKNKDNTQTCAKCGQTKEEHPVFKDEFAIDNSEILCYEFTPQIPQKAKNEVKSMDGTDVTEETEMSGSLDSNSGTLNPNVSGFLSKEIKEVEKGCGIKKVNGICGERLGGI